MRVALTTTTTARITGVAVLAAIALAGSALSSSASAAPAQSATLKTPISGKVLVTFAPGVDGGAVAEEYRGKGARLGHVWKDALNGAALDVPPGLAKQFADDPRVAAVEVDGIMSVAAAPWDLDRIDQPARPLDGVYSPATIGRGVDVYVLDTGVRSTHTEFAGRVKPGYDANGQGITEDCHGHGTMVAGLAAGATYGSAPAASIVPVRILKCDATGYYSTFVNGLDWVIADHVAGKPAVANMSIGGGSSLTLDSAVKNAVADGIVVVAAAGNEGADACTYSPARAAEALTVGATDSTDTLATWSNRGSCVDLQAPGAGVATAHHSSDTAATGGNGTSFSAPLVAGAAALVLEANPTATRAQVGATLMGATVPAAVVPSGTTQAFLQVLKAAAAPGSSPTPSPTATVSPSPSPSPKAPRKPTPRGAGGSGKGSSARPVTR